MTLQCSIHNFIIRTLLRVVRIPLNGIPVFVLNENTSSICTFYFNNSTIFRHSYSALSHSLLLLVMLMYLFLFLSVLLLFLDFGYWVILCSMRLFLLYFSISSSFSVFLHLWTKASSCSEVTTQSANTPILQELGPAIMPSKNPNVSGHHHRQSYLYSWMH